MSVPRHWDPRGLIWHIKGDTIIRIANRSRVSVSDLVAVNQLQDPSRIHAGDVLTIPIGSGYPPTRTRAPETPSPLFQDWTDQCV